MDSAPENSLASLMPLIIFFAVLVTAFIFWCFLSSCMGAPLRRSLSNLWEYTLLGAQSQSSGYRRGRGAPFGEDEMWEMESRRRG